MIDLLFPRPVYRKENMLDINECLELEHLIKNVLELNGVSRNTFNNIDSSFHTASHLDKEEGFRKFASCILNESKKFLKELSYDSNTIDCCYIHKMWANVSYDGDFIFPHNHGDCLIAGVFYVKSPPASTITFFDSFEKIKLKRKEYNMLCYEEFSYDCIPGQLLMFENNMIHGNKKQPVGEKIAVSFNIGI
jgi:uncharacterized protein (TIGR02466 family)